MRNYAILFVSLIIISCGGGGGSSAPTPNQGSTSTPTSVPTTTPATPSCDDACFQSNKEEFEALYEYSTQYGLGMTNASSAYARGATGEGMIVGVVDSGLDNSHPEITPLKVQSGSYLNYSNYTPTTKQKRHGTAVSSIAIGRRSDDGSPMHGVAFDAKVFFIAVQLGSAPEDYDPVDLGDSSGEGSPDYSGIDNFYDQVFEIFIDNGVDVINNSFGYTGTIIEYTEEQLRTNFPNTIERISQPDVLDANKTLFVWAAGNTGQYADQGADYSSPDVFPGMAYYLSELQGHSLAVVSVDEDGVISDFSNRCGVAKDFCLAAPGEGVVVAYATSSSDTGIFETSDNCVSDNSCYAVGGGTSYAAPFVSGGVALLAQHFNNQLGNTEISQRILMTADKSGIYADESIYGQGLMDLDAASKPVGSTMVATSMSLDSNLYSVISSSMSQVGSVAGDGLINAISNKGFVVFDQLGAPFNKPLRSTFARNLPSLAWLSASQSHASQRIQETDTSLTGTAILTLGLASNNYGEHDYSQSLWAKNDKKLRYLSIQGQFSNKSNYFMGNGVTPSLYLGVKNKDLGNRMGRSVLKYSPFLELSSKGSFLGAGFQLNSKSSFSAVAFKGNNPEEEYLLIKRPESTGLLVEYKKSYKDTQFSLQTGLLTEPKGFLGSSVSGAYGNLDNSDTLFSGLQIFHESDNFYTTGSIFYGKTDTNFKEQGLISSLDNFKSSSFSVGLFLKKGFGKYDSLGFQIEQPLRLEEGRMDISVPVGRTKYREVLFQDYSIDITPSGRELDFKLIHNWPFSSGIISSRIGFVKDSNHFSSQEDQFYFSTNIEFRLSE
ncbi:MAG: S8 family peptidase [SAR86 cluster bacterium]|nr:S8 family peptidase [SAR86 cluster bacterium]